VGTSVLFGVVFLKRNAKRYTKRNRKKYGFERHPMGFIALVDE
jgi:hypothetical protein